MAIPPDDPQVPVLLITAILAISFIGIIGNLTIILVTIRNKTLHSRCCRLIGIMAFFNFIVCVYVIQLRIMMLFGFYNILNTTCFYLSIYGIFAMNMQSVLGLFIGLDRLYNVSFPVRYSKIPLLSYIIAFFICVVASLFVTFSRYIFLAKEIVITICIPVTAFYETSLRIWLAFNFVIAIVVIFVYGWTHIKCRMLRNSNLHLRTAESVNRILKSLIVIIAFYVSTWFLAMTSLVLSEFLSLDGDPVNIIRRWCGWLIICNSSLHVFIYFWRTPDYRKAIIQLYCHPFNSRAGSNIQVSFVPKNQLLII